MRSSWFLLVLLSLSACRKDAKPAGELDGSWKMVRVEDRSTGQIYTAPPGDEGKVALRFSGNSFSGQTVKNEFRDGSFELKNGNELTFGLVTNATLAMEDEWGMFLVNILTACMLQSVSPCAPSIVTRPVGNQLVIDPPLRYKVTFEK